MTPPSPPGSPKVVRRSLRVKWTAALLLVAILPTAVLGAIVLDIQRRGLLRAEKELEVAVVDDASADVMRAVDAALEVTTRASSLVGDDTLSVETRVHLLSDLALAHAADIESIAFYDSERSLVDAIVVDRQTMSTRQDRALQREPPSIAPLETATALTWSREAHGVARAERAIERPSRGFVVVSLRDLDGRLAQLSEVRFGARDRILLVDESRAVRAGHSPESLASAIAIVPRDLGTELALTTEVDETVVTIRTLPSRRWALLVARPSSEAFAALTSARRAFLLSLGGFALMAALGGALFIRRALSPIESLMRQIDRYRRRDLAARSEVSSGDELEALGASLERMADDLRTSDREIARRTRIEDNLRRYLPAEAAEAAARHDADVLKLGGSRQRVTVLFADVVAFTGFAERTSPEKAVAFLSELFTMLSEIVFRHDGMVDKFIGDCVMAVFREDATSSDVKSALEAAEDMHAFASSNLPRWREEYDFKVDLGIGIASGEVLMGNLGSEARMEFTVIGDAVNVAARLEALASPGQTLTTKAVADACAAAPWRDEFDLASLGEQALRGRAERVEIFEVRA